VFWGTPPAKPLKCKSVSNRLGPPSRSAADLMSARCACFGGAGARFRQRWTESTGRKPRLSCPSSVVALARRRMDASIRLVLSDIIKTSFSFYSQCSAFRYQVSLLLRFCTGKQKPCFHFGKQGQKSFDSMKSPACQESIQFITGLMLQACG